MKNLLFAILIATVCFFSSESYAQDFRIIGGLNFANISYDLDSDLEDESDVKGKISFHIGALIDVDFNERLSFEPGLIYSSKGAKSEDEDINGKYESELTVNYLEIPLSLKYTLIDISSVRFFGTFGPYLGIGLNGKTELKAEDYLFGETFEETEDLEFGSDQGNVSRLDYGLNIGLGIEKDRFSVGATYGLGLANLEPYDDSVDINNRVFRISLGYLIN